MWQKTAIAVLIASAISTHAFNHLCPHGKEAIYTWRATVKAGTDLPTPHASQFHLQGKLHLQANPNSTHVKLTDLTYKLYNGILDHVHEHEAHNVPVQIPHLEHVFRVVYDPNGLVVGIVTENQDKEFSRNIKKAIATILQMDDSVLKEERHHHHHPHSFVLREHSIYGRFNVDYTVRHHQNGDVEVHKLHDMRDSEHLYHGMFSNYEECHCDARYEEPLQHTSHKEYHIGKHEGHHVVKEIRVTGGLLYQPHRGESDHQFVLVNQTLHLSQVVPIQQPLHIQEEHFEDHLTYHYYTDSSDGSIHDVTNGRRVLNYDKVVPTVQHMLEDIHHYLHENHIHTQEPDSKRGQMINRVQRLLQMFSLKKLQELHQKVTGDALHILHHVLPLVGSEASTLFIKHLVVNKIVKDEVAVEMLQHFPEHVHEPTVELLNQLEELINMGEDRHWNVRRCALLSFATLIHKSHRFVERIHRNREIDHHINHVEHHYTHQQPYEKYVLTYLNHLRSSQDYKVQMAYALSLGNMGLHSIVQHILPAVYGDWYNDYHFRLLSLWVMGLNAVHDPEPNTIIETVWPIFIDGSEITEMRVLAFYFLMKNPLSQSRLINMYDHLLEERNPEVYKIVYSYLHDLSHSDNPCNEDLRVRAAHLVNLLPPPTHGKSFAHINDYHDLTHHFGSEVNAYYTNGDHSLIYALETLSQNFHIYHEDHFVYFRVHGLEHQGDPVHFWVDVFRNRIPKKLTTSKDLRIECIVMRHGHVINSHFFNKENLHELNSVLDFFTKDAHSLEGELMHLSYDEYHRDVIPTDLGVPALFEYLTPVVHHHNLTLTKEVTNKVAQVHVDYRHMNWVHYRHGLSFYNPVADIWQGINRFHSYDSVLPLRFDLSINTQQQSVQISWKRHNHEVTGFRSHVKQMVFVKDDHGTNVLIQSSPQCKEYVIVTHGQQFRHEYVVAQDSSLTTGHQWYVAVYDSAMHFSNGTHGHILHTFTQSHSKPHESPLRHLLTSCLNYHDRVFLLPERGTHGVIARIEPTHEHPVTNIDLSVRLHSEPITDDSFHYTPKVKWSARMTYSVKNQDRSLKTWDVNTILDLNQGHTINNLKMHVTRIVPGQHDYKICIDGVKKWTEKGVTGHVNVAMSQTPDGKCVKDDTVIDVTMTGHRSHDQEEGHHKYGSCQHISPYSVPHRHSLECLVDHTTARHYVYNVKTTNVPVEFRKHFEHWWDTIKGHYMDHYEYQDEHNENIGEHTLRVDVEYPMEEEEEVDVHVTTPQHVYRLTGVPTHHWKWMGLHPDSLEYPQWFQYLHEGGLVDHLAVEPDHYHCNRRQVDEECPNEWTLHYGNSAQNPTTAVYVKRVANNEIGVKIVDHGHTIEMVPHGAHHQVTLDGTVVPISEYHHADWVYCHVFNQDYHHPVACMLQNSGIHVEYHHHQVVVVVPREEGEVHGRCYDHH